MSTVKSIKTGGDYTTIAGWEADLSLFAGDDCIGELYDEVYTPAAYITINDTSPASITLRAHSSARHDGTPGSGARVDGGSFGYAGVFTITTTVPTNIEWVDVYNFGYRSSAFVTQSTGAVVIASCIARDPLSTRSPYAGPYAINLSGEVHVVNCGVWGVFDDLGIMLQKWGTAGTRTAWNCTVYGCDYGISSGSSGGYTREAVNCISVGHTGATGNDWGGTFSKTYCMDSDGTLPASTGNVSSVTVADQFVSTVAGSEDLHLKLGSDAIGAGSDLGTTAGVNFDVDGRDRDAEGDTWDMGWDQWYVAGKVAVGATWNNAASWSPSGVPTASDDVVFVAGSPSMAIDTAAVCASLTSTGYTNTLTQNAGQTLTVSGDIAWAAGTFTGGDSAISAETFTLTGGAWTSTSDTFSVGRAGTGTQTPWASSGGVFTHNSGTVLWDDYIPGYGSLTSYVTITAAISFYDLRVRGGLPYNYVHYYNLGGSTATITVDNDLEFFSSSSYGFFVLGHEIQLNGNVSSSDVLGMSTVVDIVGNTAQTYTCSGGGVAVRLPVGTTSTFSSTTTDAGLSGITVEAGTFVAPTGTLSIGYNLSNDSAVSVNALVVTGGTFTHNSGSLVLEPSCTGYAARTGVITATTPLTLNDVTFSGGAAMGPSAAYGLYYDFSGSSAAITVEGDLVLTKSQSWAPYYNGHEIQLDGNLTCTDSRGGSTVVDIVGNTAQTYTWTSGVIAVRLPAGTTSTFSSTTTDARFAGITVEAGTFVAPTGILSIGDLLSQASTNALVVTGGTFTHNSGSIVLDSYHTSYAFRVALVTATTPLTLNDVTFSGGYGQNHPAYAQAYDFSGSSAAITVEGDLVLTKTQSYAPWLNGGTLTLQGNLTCTNCSGGTTAITLNGTGDQTITETAGDWPAGTWTNSNTAGKVRQATDVTLGDDLTIASSATWCMHGFGLTIGGDLVITGSLIKHLAGDASPTVTGSTTGSVTTGSCYPYHIAVGSSPMDWSVAANWLPASVPTSSDDVVLDNAIDVNIDTAAVCASLTSSGYSGTLTQEAGQTLTVSGDIAWAAGTFAGGDSAIDALSFSLTAGTWTSTSGTFTIGETVAANRTSFVYSGGTFTHNSGTVLWDSQNTWTGQVTTVTITTAIAFNNLTVSGGTFNASYPQYYDLATSSADIDVDATLTFDKIQAFPTYCMAHALRARGDVVINDYNGAGTTLTDIVGNTTQTYSWTAGNIEVRLPTGTTSTFTPGTADAQFVGVTVQDGTFVAPTGTLTLFASTSTRNAMLSMGGTFTHNSGTVVFAYVNYWAGAQATVTVTSPISFNNVTFTGGSTLSTHHNVYQLGASSATITVEGDLLLDSTQTYASFIEGYELTVLGDVTCTACRGGSTAITLNGTGDQTITETAGDWPGGTWTNSNTAGKVRQATDVTLGDDLTIASSATWCMHGFGLTIGGDLVITGSLLKHLAGDASPTVTGSTTGSVTTGSCYSNHIAVGSSPMDWSVAANWLPASVPTSSDDVVLDNAIDVNIDTAAVCASLTSTGYSGTLTQNAGQTLTVSGDIAWAAGTFTGGDSQIQAEMFSLTGGTWTCTSGTLRLALYENADRTFLIYSGGTYTHSSGRMEWAQLSKNSGLEAYVTVTTPMTLNHLDIKGAQRASSSEYDLLGSTSTITVEGDLLLAPDRLGIFTYPQLNIVGGTIDLEGNLSAPASTGTAPNHTGQLNICTLQVNIKGNTTQTYATQSGSGPKITLPTGTTSTFQPAAGTEGDTHGFCNLTIQAGTFVAPSGTVTLYEPDLYPQPPNSAFLTFSGGTYTHSNGTMKWDQFSKGANKTFEVAISSPLTLNNLTIGGAQRTSNSEYDLTGISSTLTVLGDLLFAADGSLFTYSRINMIGGLISVGGNVTAAASSPEICTTSITLNGTGEQTINQPAGNFTGGTWTNSNTAGHVIQATDVALGGDLETDFGTTWCQESYALTVAGTTTNNGTIKRASSGVTTPTIGSGNPVEIGPCAAPAEDETALLKRDQLRSLAHHSSSKRLIGRTGNILLRRRHRRILG